MVNTWVKIGLPKDTKFPPKSFIGENRLQSNGFLLCNIFKQLRLEDMAKLLLNG